MTPDLVIERAYRHPIWRVWGAITEPNSMARWLGPTDFQPIVGHVFNVHLPKLPGFDGHVVGEVMEIEAPNRIRMFWRGGPVRSHVCIELEASGNSTRLKLTQTGFDREEQSALATRLGPFWATALGTRLEGVLVPAAGAAAIMSPLVAATFGVLTLILMAFAAVCAVGWFGSASDRAAAEQGAVPGLDTRADPVLQGDDRDDQSGRSSPASDRRVYSGGFDRDDLPVLTSRAHKHESLRFYEASLPTTLNPLYARTMVDMRSRSLVFDRLYDRSAITNELESSLVARDEVQRQGRALQVTLKAGLRWHDGHPITASDLCFTVDVLLNEANPSTSSRSFREALSGCEVIDDEAARIVYRQAQAFPRERAAFYVLPRHAFDGQTNISPDADFGRAPVGSGPYAGKLGRRQTLFSARPSVQHDPQIAELQLSEGGDPFVQTRTHILGKIDGVVSVAPPLRPEISASDTAALKSYDLRSWWFIAVNTHSGALADPQVRRALDLSLDRTELRELTIGVDRNDPNPPCQFISGPYLPNSPFYNRSVPEQPRSDRAQAATLLALAGLRRINGRWHYHGKPVVLRVGMHAPLDIEAKDLLNQVGNQLQAAGFDRQVYKVSADDWNRRVVTGESGAFDLVIGKWSFAGLEDIEPMFHSRTSNRGEYNIFHYSDPDVDDLLERHRDARSDVEARDASHDLHALLAKQRPYLFLWKLDTKSSWAMDVRHNVISPYTYFDEVEKWTLER